MLWERWYVVRYDMVSCEKDVVREMVCCEIWHGKLW